jgi:hypothetical protein
MSTDAAPVRLTPRNLSCLVWQQFLEQVEFELPTIVSSLREVSARCEVVRSDAQYDTGSMLLGSAFSLYLAARVLRPHRVFEVGTFIGKSAIAMGLAMQHAGSTGDILTCDASNDITLPALTSTRIRQFPMTTSTAAIRQCLTEGIDADFLHIDGRLADEDSSLLSQFCTPDTVVALDDFEGMEKGVVNLMSLRRQPLFSRHVCIYPMPESLSRSHGAIGASLTALLIPATRFAFTNQ